VPAGRGERDPPRFWLAVLAALRQTGPGSVLVRELTAAPDLDGWVITERLLDLALLDEALWLVVDDVQELGPETLRQLELLIRRAPRGLRFVLATRHDVRLGLHRLRLEGELAEIRTDDLRFSLAEARQLFAAAGVQLEDPSLAKLHERTEGWVAGLRLAALSLAGHPDPGRFAGEFSGTERTVAEYLLAEVPEGQGEPVRRLLLRTSILERVNSWLAVRLPDQVACIAILSNENRRAPRPCSGSWSLPPCTTKRRKSATGRASRGALRAYGRSGFDMTQNRPPGWSALTASAMSCAAVTAAGDSSSGWRAIASACVAA
jgi:ATP/maltotriose-dependent transcriptional regulator MalT